MERYLLWCRMYTPRPTVCPLEAFVFHLSSLQANSIAGLITGVTGAAGDLGGIIFLLINRYSGTDYGRVFWIVGIITIAGNLLVSWIRPIPKGQLGGR